jgi:hypothetical protein
MAKAESRALATSVSGDLIRRSSYSIAPRRESAAKITPDVD